MFGLSSHFQNLGTAIQSSVPWTLLLCPFSFVARIVHIALTSLNSGAYRCMWVFMTYGLHFCVGVSAFLLPGGIKGNIEGQWVVILVLYWLAVILGVFLGVEVTTPRYPGQTDWLGGSYDFRQERKWVRATNNSFEFQETEDLVSFTLNTIWFRHAAFHMAFTQCEGRRFVYRHLFQEIAIYPLKAEVMPIGIYHTSQGHVRVILEKVRPGLWGHWKAPVRGMAGRTRSNPWYFGFSVVTNGPLHVVSHEAIATNPIEFDRSARFLRINTQMLDAHAACSVGDTMSLLYSSRPTQARAPVFPVF